MYVDYFLGVQLEETPESEKLSVRESGGVIPDSPSSRRFLRITGSGCMRLLR